MNNTAKQSISLSHSEEMQKFTDNIKDYYKPIAVELFNSEENNDVVEKLIDKYVDIAQASLAIKYYPTETCSGSVLHDLMQPMHHLGESILADYQDDLPEDQQDKLQHVCDLLFNDKFDYMICNAPNSDDFWVKSEETGETDETEVTPFPFQFPTDKQLEDGNLDNGEAYVI